MIKLYHGSYIEVVRPLAKVGRRNLDFGPGFYLTQIKPQAEAWSIIVSSRKGRFFKPIISCYEFDLETALSDGVRIKRFETYNIEWLNYVVDCRNGKDFSGEYDIIEGGVANDNVIDTVEDYEKGIITANQALGQLIYKKVNHQLCILSQHVIDNYLRFRGSSILENKD